MTGAERQVVGLLLSVGQSSSGSGTAPRTCFANAGDDVHMVGSLEPLASLVACVVISPDGSRTIARTQPDPLAQPESD